MQWNWWFCPSLPPLWGQFRPLALGPSLELQGTWFYVNRGIKMVKVWFRCEWKLSTVKEAFISTVVFIGMMCSSSPWGAICDKFGQRSEIIRKNVYLYKTKIIGINSERSKAKKWIDFDGSMGFLYGFTISFRPILSMDSHFTNVRWNGSWRGSSISYSLFWIFTEAG